MMNSNLLPVDPLTKHTRESIIDNVIGQVARDTYRLAEAPPSQPKHWLWLGIGLSAAAGVLVLLLLRPSILTTPSVARTGEPTRVVAGDAASTVTVGTSTLTLGARSSVLVNGDDDRGIEVNLENGSVLCQVAPRHGRPPFQVVAGHVRIVVVGTEFAVSRTNQLVSVDVTSGEVRIIAGGKETLLNAGGRWSSDDNKPEKLPERTKVNVPPAPTARPSTSVAPERTSGRRRTRDDIRKAPVKTPKNDTPKTDRTTPKNDALEPPQKHSDEVRYKRAASLERSSPEEAMALYRQVEESGGGWAASALFARARLHLERGGTQTARQLLSRYLRLHPQGANAAMAKRLLSENQ